MPRRALRHPVAGVISTFAAAGPRLGVLGPETQSLHLQPPDFPVTLDSSVERREPEPSARQEHIPRAIFYMIAAGLIFSFSTAASKWLVGIYPVGEVLFSRVFVGFVLFAAFVLPSHGMAVFNTNRPVAHVLRSVSQTTSQSLLLIALSMMPMASAIAINFSAPLFATLASLLFPEGVGRRRALGRAVDRIPRCADRHQSGLRDASRSARCSRSPIPSCSAP